MKLQGISVIFALIVLPLILVLTYYIQLQVDTIEMQNEYDRKLLDSTYGAMSAFEINTANEDLSSVSDSLRTIIDASTNVFMNTLSTNFGMSNASRSYLEPYIPAILYTLYDGYYISAPTRTPIFLVDSSGNAVTVGSPGVSITATGDFTYSEVHTSMENQNNCTICEKTQLPSGKYSVTAKNGHVLYDDGDNIQEPTEYRYMPVDKQADLQITFEQLKEKGKEEFYSQLLYKTKDEGVYTTDINSAELEIDHVLKTYMPYSARYKNGKPKDPGYFDITVVYTLDNYITIQGNIGDIYYTKSGYFIPDGVIKVSEIKENVESGLPDNETDIEKKPEKLLTFNQNDAKQFIETGAFVKIEIEDKRNSDGSVDTSGGTILTSGGHGKSAETLKEEQRIYNNRFDKANNYLAQIKKLEDLSDLSPDDLNTINTFLNETGYDFTGIGSTDIESKLEFAKIQLTKDLNDIQYNLDEMSAVTYYVTAEIFSNWIYENLVKGENAIPIKEKHLVEISGQNYKLVKGKTQVTHDFKNSEAIIFDIENSENKNNSTTRSVMEIAKDSPFYTHKLNVIRDSIQYNLNLAMSTYNNMLISTKDYAMPVIQNEEWEKILNNVSIVSFMQGYNCGLKTYSNYKIVSSTNNEISVLPENIYYVEKSKFSDETTEYHRIDCPKLYANDKTTNKYMTFISKDVKYDKIYDKSNAQIPYEYDHKNFACYDCINDGNYDRTAVLDTVNFDNYNNKFPNLRKAYYIGVGKSRNDLYKMNAIDNSEGYEIIYDKKSLGAFSSKSSSLPLEKIKAVEIVLDTIKTHDSEENVLNYKVKVYKSSGFIFTFQIKEIYLNDSVYTVVPNVATTTTLKIEVDPLIDDEVKISKWNLFFENIFEQSTAYTETDTGISDILDGLIDTIIELLPGELLKSTTIVRNSIKHMRIIYR